MKLSLQLPFTGLLILLANTVLAIEYTVAHFDPPILFNAEGFKEDTPDQEWVTAFLATRAPIQLSADQFNASMSHALREKHGVSAEAFESMVARTPKGQPYQSILAEAKFSHQGEEYRMLIIYPAELKAYPESKGDADGFIAKEFFKRVNHHWIMWTMPHDMDYDDPITDIEYTEVLWPVGSK